METQQIIEEANLIIAKNGQNEIVLEFIKACAINVTALEVEGDYSGMQFKIGNEKFIFKRCQ